MTTLSGVPDRYTVSSSERRGGVVGSEVLKTIKSIKARAALTFDKCSPRSFFVFVPLFFAWISVIPGAVFVFPPFGAVFINGDIG